MNIKWNNSKLPSHIQNSLDGDQGEYDYDAHDEMPEGDIDDQIEDFLVEEQLQEPEAHNEVVISEALKRIEQASLYQTLINHSLFAPNSARPEIMALVENEIKAFAVDRLEVLLGMRTESKSKAIIQEQFTQEEAVALKAIASRLMQKNEVPAERNPSVNLVAQPSPSKPALSRIAHTPKPAPRQPVQPQQDLQAALQQGAQPKQQRAPRAKKSGSPKDPTRNYAQAGNPNAMKMPHDLVMSQPNLSTGIISNGVNLSSAVLEHLKK